MFHLELKLQVNVDHSYCGQRMQMFAYFPDGYIMVSSKVTQHKQSVDGYLTICVRFRDD